MPELQASIYKKRGRGMIANEIIIHFRPNSRLSTLKGHHTAYYNTVLSEQNTYYKAL